MGEILFYTYVIATVVLGIISLVAFTTILNENCRITYTSKRAGGMFIMVLLLTIARLIFFTFTPIVNMVILVDCFRFGVKGTLTIK